MSISELDLELDKGKMKGLCDEGDSPLHADMGGTGLCRLCLKLLFWGKSIPKFLLTSVGPEFPFFCLIKCQGVK